ncbi:hypothetical protein DICVIV_03210 [Dictyocaulus viviparus]|uniref:Sodium/calcium exchanger domain-containing protein n=1 Tax=Dictyocaulus viviparus TaxID=29172 RepID=A0A0D8Y175_DICVI|nr:hypothetical protein DICVIV_03210 [Dictyocaulus viviparus]
MLYINYCFFFESIPSGEVRRIQHTHVFWVTLAWSMFAYVWLYVILCVFSPNEVENSFHSAQHPDASIEDLKKLATKHVICEQKKSRAFYRIEFAIELDSIQSIRKLIGQGDIRKNQFEKKAQELIEPLVKKNEDTVVVEQYINQEHIIFKLKQFAIELDSIQSIRKLIGQGDIRKNQFEKKAQELIEPLVKKNEDTVVVETIADTAEENSDFVPIQGMLTFKPGVDELVSLLIKTYSCSQQDTYDPILFAMLDALIPRFQISICIFSLLDLSMQPNFGD